MGLAATITAMDAANAVAVEWGLGASTPGVLDNVRVFFFYIFNAGRRTAVYGLFS